MKKIIAIIISLVVSFTTVSASAQENGYALEINGEMTQYSSVVFNDIHYVPMRMILEKMGASVFYRSSDRQILALSKSGDVIRHTVESNIVSVNGEDIEFINPSVLDNNTTYIPLDMIISVFYPEMLVENEQINIKKEFVCSEYARLIQDVLDMSKDGDFKPEKFQEYINYHAQMPSYSIEDVIFRVNIGLVSSFYENIKTIEYPNELLVLVNKYNRLPENFTQYNLVDMSRVYTDGAKQYLLVDTAYEKYAQMADAARKEGLSMRVVSSYRTESYQAGLYNNKLYSTGRVNADNYSARPGHSEHQTGLAVDINSTKGSFEYTSEFKWLQQHAHEYGFIMRYPRGKEWITGYAYEPWHYRFVGVDAATVIHNEGITYEEYYAKYVDMNEYR